MQGDKRTDVDFSKHEVLVTEQEGLLIHYLKKPGTICNSIKYINTNGILAVTGDFGNWIFCREFHPSAEGHVSDGYWCEKLRSASTQTCSDFSPTETEEEIKRLLAEEEDLTEEEIEYLNDCLSAVDAGEFDYTIVAHRQNVGRFQDHENVPLCKELTTWLKCVFDGFDEICRRMKEEQEGLKEGADKAEVNTPIQSTISAFLALSSYQKMAVIRDSGVDVGNLNNALFLIDKEFFTQVKEKKLLPKVWAAIHKIKPFPTDKNPFL